MLYQIASDVHGSQLDPIDVEEPVTLIIAGDFGEVNHATTAHYLRELCGRYHMVIHVFGNHEYYKGSLRTAREKLAAQVDKENYKILENDFVVIDDVVIAGATMWSDLTNPLHANNAQFSMNDYRYIRTGPGTSGQSAYTRKMTTQDTTVMHLESVKFFEDILKIFPDKDVVFVSHHAPSFLSIAPAYVTDSLNSAFATEVPLRPTVWIHGHIHYNWDYILDSTRVICNPHGYPGEFNIGFQPRKFIRL